MLRRLRIGLWLVLLTPLAAGGYLWWHVQQSEVYFLSQRAPAEWIVFPAKYDLAIHKVSETAITFKKSFYLHPLPERAVVAVAGCRRYTVAVNGVMIGAGAGAAWKTIREFDAKVALRAGENEIAVTVMHSNGPPALWLSMQADGLTLSSDETWEAENPKVGSGWYLAALAGAPRIPEDTAELGEDRPGSSLGLRWRTLLLFAVLAGGLVWWTERRRQAVIGDEREAGERVWLAGAAVLWLALFINNAGWLRQTMGYDAGDHVAYIRHIQTHWKLPTAADGWQMFQPPLYYAVAAVLLKALGLGVDGFGAMVLRFLGVGLGVAQVLILRGSLRLLFPSEPAQRQWGLLLAAGAPVLIYVSQFITNEAAAGVLISASVYLGLRILQRPGAALGAYALLGGCVGAALLTKATALLVVPPIFGALLWRQLERREISWGRWLGRAGLALVVCGVVCGWHYGRTWMLYGSPFIGGWDARTGLAWWQDNGYHTSEFFLRFGRPLTYPWFSGLDSFADGIYSSYWGDSLYGGMAGVDSRPPWNYDLMAAGYLLALLPTVLIVTGAGWAVWRFIRQPSAEWFLILGLAFLMGLALVGLSLDVPFQCSVKASYVLGALVPVGAFGVLGLERVAGRAGIWRNILCVGLGVWAINAYASFWIRHDSPAGLVARTEVLYEQGRYAEAIEPGRRAAQVESTNVWVFRYLGSSYLAVAKYPEAVEALQRAVALEPDSEPTLKNLASALGHAGRTLEAVTNYVRALELNPEDADAHHQLGRALASLERWEEAIVEYRWALQHNPVHFRAQFNLAKALVALGRKAEATAELRAILRVAPEDAGVKEMLRELEGK